MGLEISPERIGSEFLKNFLKTNQIVANSGKLGLKQAGDAWHR
jgi:hypothetical protein